MPKSTIVSNEDDVKQFTERVRNLRRSLGVSSKEMAAIMGIDYQTYDYWELGIRRPVKIVNRYLDMIDMIRIFHPETFDRFVNSALGRK